MHVARASKFTVFAGSHYVMNLSLLIEDILLPILVQSFNMGRAYVLYATQDTVFLAKLQGDVLE